MIKPTKDELDLLNWLSKEDSSAFGECHGETLDALMLNYWVFIDGHRVHVSPKGKEVLALYGDLDSNLMEAHKASTVSNDVREVVRELRVDAEITGASYPARAADLLEQMAREIDLKNAGVGKTRTKKQKPD
jgi:hypothetical protein